MIIHIKLATGLLLQLLAFWYLKSAYYFFQNFEKYTKVKSRIVLIAKIITGKVRLIIPNLEIHQN